MREGKWPLGSTPYSSITLEFIINVDLTPRILPSDYLTTALNKRELPDERLFDLGASNNGNGPLHIASFDKRLGGEFNGWSVTVPIADLV